MSVFYEIRQRVDTINKSWLETVYKSNDRRVAQLSFYEIRSFFPNAYIELIEISHSEKCLQFTGTDIKPGETDEPTTKS